MALVAAVSAMRTGFTLPFQRPAVFAAEVAWRWALGAALGVLLLVAGAEYLAALSIAPGLLPLAWSNFLRLAAAILGGWVLLSAIGSGAGRVAILAAIFDGHLGHKNFPALLWLGFLRAVLAIAAVASLAGAWLLACLVSGSPHRFFALPDAAGFWLVFCPLALIVLGAWTWLYWIVALACLPAVQDGLCTRDALVHALDLVYDRPAELGAIGFVFLLARFFVVYLAAQIGFFVFALMSYSPAATLGLLAVVAAAYVIASEYLFVSRLAAYADLIERAESKMQP